MAEPSGPLAGVRVIDAATLFAGPLAAMFLGDLGADVVKVEHPAKPDRGPHPRAGADGVGAVVEDARSQQAHDDDQPVRTEGATCCCASPSASDVLIENFRPGTLERWGIGPDGCMPQPRLVVARVTAFGQVGPLARSPASGRSPRR